MARGAIWTPEEDDLLCSYVGSMTVTAAYARYCEEAQIKGFPPRKFEPFRRRIATLGLSASPSYGSIEMSLSAWQSLLGINRQTISRWCDKGWLPSRKERNYLLIKKSDMATFIKSCPGRFRLGNLEQIQDFFGGAIAESIRNEKPVRMPCKIKDRWTGKVYKNGAELLRLTAISRRKFYRELKDGHPRWQRVI